MRINGARIDAASRVVRPGDVVTVAFDAVKILKVMGFSERRGSATEAASLYENVHVAAPKARESETPELESELPTRRPSKRERRDIVRLKRPEHGD